MISSKSHMPKVKKFFKMFYREIDGLHEAAYLLGIFAVLSQILALLRDRVLAAHFGTGHILDLYYASFEIPDFIFATVASIVSLSVLVPFITERLAKSKEETREYINAIFSVFLAIIVFVCIIAFFCMPYLAPRVFPGIGDTPTLITMARILLLSPIFLGLSNFLASITQVGKRFLVYALSPLFYNLGIIIGAVFFYPIFGIYGLVYGVVFGVMMHLGIQLPFVFKSGLFKPWPLHFDFKKVKDVFLISIPRTITLGMTQITTLALVSMASLMTAGSITIFNLSSNLQGVPLSIIGVSYSLAAFPTLSQFITLNQASKFLSHISAAIRHTIFWSIPISVLFIVLRAQIVRTLYGSGDFGWDGTKLTAAALAIFAVSITAQSLVLIFIRGYYAKGDTKKSLYASIVTGVLSIGLSYIFVKIFYADDFFRFFMEHLFRVDGIAGTEIMMLALGFSLAQIINCIILWIWFSIDNPGFSSSTSKTLFQSFSASVIMGFVSYLCLGIFNHVFNINTVIGIFMQGFLSGIIGIIALILMLKLLKSYELEETIHILRQTLEQKFSKTRPILPDTDAADLK
jgi:putative peptidoglycan lipid II flippase